MNLLNVSAANRLHQAPELFSKLENIITLAESDNAANGFSKAMLDIKIIDFNPEAFNYVALDDGSYKKVDSKLMMGQSLSFSPPNLNSPLNLEVLKVAQHLKGRNLITYSGKVKGAHHSTFTFSVDDETIVGWVKHKGLIYYIEPNSALAGQLTLSVLNESKIPKDPYDADEYKPSQADKGQFPTGTHNRSSANGHIKVLFKYASNVYGASTKAANFITDFNNVLSNNGVSSNNFISSAGVQMVADDFNGLCKRPILKDYMEEREGVFTDLSSEMIAVGADVVILLVNGPAGPSGCHSVYSGRVGGIAKIWNSTHPFVVIADNYLGAAADMSGVHELGHVLRGQHPSTGFTPNRGIINTTNSSEKWQSIMGSYDTTTSCNFTGPIDTGCERLPYFSNPALTHPSGNPLGHTSRNMKRHLETAMVTASNWRGAPVPPPAIPSGFTVDNPSQCYGFYRADWGSVSGTTEYKLLKSTNPSFTGAQTIYSGGATGTNFNVTSGTWYLRVKACNAGGCSDLTSHESAARLNYCL